MKVILTKHGEINKIAAMLGVSRLAVRNALKFRFNTELCQRIRKVALERGGKVTEYCD
ncbi:MAG: ArsR family transcriptional regulator [Bacteroidales bacterium]|nr:ArsR family transcriptional regulator [Candidatus Cryptobacteroides equifaecalis]